MRIRIDGGVFSSPSADPIAEDRMHQINAEESQPARSGPVQRRCAPIAPLQSSSKRRAADAQRIGSEADQDGEVECRLLPPARKTTRSTTN
ncbi:hypothetical protein [Prauserella aidingensis]|uniref:hypothetical protein n=1 Tax=Prauserella aidingensis TaxID=387890 RepID=UPI0020A5215E|nr:hypothetical protein [Prauserella aidingensis]